jgi:hypothetical protein
MPYDRLVTFETQRRPIGGPKMSDDEKTRKELEEDANEDLDLEDEDAEKVGGGVFKITETPMTSPDKW